MTNIRFNTCYISTQLRYQSIGKLQFSIFLRLYVISVPKVLQGIPRGSDRRGLKRHCDMVGGRK